MNQKIKCLLVLSFTVFSALAFCAEQSHKPRRKRDVRGALKGFTPESMNGSPVKAKIRPKAWKPWGGNEAKGSAKKKMNVWTRRKPAENKDEAKPSQPDMKFNPPGSLGGACKEEEREGLLRSGEDTFQVDDFELSLDFYDMKIFCVEKGVCVLDLLSPNNLPLFQEFLHWQKLQEKENEELFKKFCEEVEKEGPLPPYDFSDLPDL